jgi:hypothetical protein
MKRAIPLLACAVLLTAALPAHAQLFRGLFKRPIVQQLLNTPIQIAGTPFGNISITPRDFFQQPDNKIMLDSSVRQNIDDAEQNISDAADITNKILDDINPDRAKKKPKNTTDRPLRTTSGPLKKGG